MGNNGSAHGSKKHDPKHHDADKPPAMGAGGADQEEAVAMSPVEKLAKILTDKSREETGVNGIGLGTFTRYLFPRYQSLAEKLYQYFRLNADPNISYITTAGFKTQCDKFLAILDDSAAVEILVRMHATEDEQRPGALVATPRALRDLLMCSYHVAMDHYSEGPQMCLAINRTLRAVVDSCFHRKERLSAQFVAHWLEANAPRLLLPIHRYCVHCLATSHRTLEVDGPPLAAGLELATPVLDQPPIFGDKPPHPHLLHMSMSWLLAGALSPLYSRPRRANSPSNSGTGLASVNFLTKLLFAVPSHWLILYDSAEQGLGANRFLHHVLAYKGPTLLLIKSDDGQLFCVAAPCEWRESHLYWGGEDCAVFQLLPKFLMLEKGSKMLYLNMSVRGYPLGLRAGKDPRNPIIAIEGGFEKFEFRKIPLSIASLEVWGCGDPSNREAQLDVKRWQVREAERQRCVKLSAADWLDHPDRYLLELAGRPVYNQKQT